MLARLHLVRHGEVHNPDGLVYADLPGFHLSDLGRRQAEAAAAHLATERIAAVVASPLDRAQETAAPIAAAVGIAVTGDERLTEWGLSGRWAGVPWADLDTHFPGELAAYARTPDDLPFSPESIDAVAARMAAVVTDLGARHPGETAVIVSHQDPVQALRLALRGIALAALGDDKPVHACVITLQPAGDRWVEVASWRPPLGGAAFPPPQSPRSL